MQEIDILNLIVVELNSVRFPKDLVEYIFKKYTILVTDDPDKESHDATKYITDNEKIYRLNIYVLLASRCEWMYFELMSEMNAAIHCDFRKMNHEELIKSYGTIAEVKTYNELSSKLVRQKHPPVPFEFYGVEIIKKNHDEILNNSAH